MLWTFSKHWWQFIPNRGSVWSANRAGNARNMPEKVAEVSGTQLKCQVRPPGMRYAAVSGGGPDRHPHVCHARLTLWWTWVETASSSIRSGDVLSVSMNVMSCEGEHFTVLFTCARSPKDVRSLLSQAFIYLRTGDNSTVGYIQGVNGAMQVRPVTSVHGVMLSTAS